MKKIEKQYAYPCFSSVEQMMAWETQAVESLLRFLPALLKSPAAVALCAARKLNEESGGAFEPCGASAQEWIASCAQALYQSLYDRVYGDYYLYAPPSAFTNASKGQHPRRLLMSSYEDMGELSRRSAELEAILRDMMIPLEHLAQGDVGSAVKNWSRIKDERVRETEEELERFRKDYDKVKDAVKQRMRSYKKLNERVMADPSHGDRARALLDAYVEGTITLSTEEMPPSMAESFLTDLARYRALTMRCPLPDPSDEETEAYIRAHLVELVLLAASGAFCPGSWLLRMRLRLGARRVLRMARRFSRTHDVGYESEKKIEQERGGR